MVAAVLEGDRPAREDVVGDVLGGVVVVAVVVPVDGDGVAVGEGGFDVEVVELGVDAGR